MSVKYFTCENGLTKKPATPFDRTTVVVETVQYIFIFVYEVLEFLRNVMKSHGKVIEFYLRISMGTLLIRLYLINNILV